METINCLLKERRGIRPRTALARSHSEFNQRKSLIREFSQKKLQENAKRLETLRQNNLRIVQKSFDNFENRTVLAKSVDYK
jgi:DNA-binding PadR family transcriptional regulator